MGYSFLGWCISLRVMACLAYVCLCLSSWACEGGHWEGCGCYTAVSKCCSEHARGCVEWSWILWRGKTYLCVTFVHISYRVLMNITTSLKSPSAVLLSFSEQLGLQKCLHMDQTLLPTSLYIYILHWSVGLFLAVMSTFGSNVDDFLTPKMSTLGLNLHQEKHS